MHPFDVLLRFGLGGDPDRMPLPGVHRGRRSPADPDATPRPRPPLTARQRASVPRASVYVNARLTDEEEAGEARVLNRLAALTCGTGGLSALDAAQVMFARRLRKGRSNG
jgi:hypothetical protein